jgi:hypothetical protein
MKNIILIVLFGLVLAGCESSTQFGSCVGLGDKQNPKLEYKVSVLNLVVGILFVEMIIPPVIVAANETYCPVGKVEQL